MADPVGNNSPVAAAVTQSGTWTSAISQPANMWRLSTSFATVGPITIAAAGAAGQTTYISGLQITNSGTTACRLTLNDSATSSFSIPGSTATTAVPVNMFFSIPLISNTTATTTVGTLSALSTSIFVSLQGYYQ